MTSKERLQTALEHEEPDRVPFMATFVPEMELALKKRYARELREIHANVEMKYQGMNELDILFGHDMLLLTYGLSTGYYRVDRLRRRDLAIGCDRCRNQRLPAHDRDDVRRRGYERRPRGHRCFERHHRDAQCD